MTKEESEQWFKDAPIVYSVLDPYLLEELYQAFKSRMLAEIRKAEEDELFIGH